MLIIKQSSTFLIVKWLLMLGNFLTGMLVARFLGPEGKGAVAVIVTSVNFLAAILNFGLPTAALYYYKQRRFSISNLIAASVVLWSILGCLTAIAVFWFRDPFTKFLLSDLNQKTIPEIWLFLILVMLPGQLLSSLLSILLVLDGHGLVYMIWSLAGQVTAIILTIVFVGWLELGVTGVLLANTAVQMLALLVAMVWFIYLIRAAPFQMDWSVFGGMLRIGSEQYLASLAANIMKRGEIFVLAFLLDLRAVGVYIIAMNLYEHVIDMPRSFLDPIAGWIADRNHIDRLASTLIMLRLQILATFFLIIIAGLFIPPLIPIVYGYSFLTSASLLVFLLPGVLFRSVHLGVLAFFIGIGKPGKLIPCLVAAAIVNIGLDFILIPYFGVYGAAIATVIAEMTLGITSLAMFIWFSGGKWSDAIFIRYADLQMILSVFLRRNPERGS